MAVVVVVAGLAMGLGADGRQMVTACSGGSLKFWDIRSAGGPGLVRAVEAHSGGSGLTCLAAHPAAPLLATGTKTHTVKVFSKPLPSFPSLTTSVATY
jgi:WD40 repeat protein